jgi:high-affinity Fe2+/Pb2+ permease
MNLGQQFMYWAGTLIMLVVSVVSFIYGTKLMQEREQEGWQEECKQQIETIGKTQNVSG